MLHDAPPARGSRLPNPLPPRDPSADNSRDAGPPALPRDSRGAWNSLSAWGPGMRTLAAVLALTVLAASSLHAATLDTHTMATDGSGKLLSWVTPQDKAFDRVAFLSWDLLKNRIPNDPANGL